METRDATPAGVSRRQALKIGALGALLACVPGTARALVPARGERSLAFHHTHTGEHLRCVYWQDGDYLPSALAEIDHHLRDHRTGGVMPIARGLLDELHTLRRVMETREPFQVISGYRSPATNAMLAARGNGVVRKSFHTRGMAIDVALPRRDPRDLQRAALALHAGGVGLYEDSGFVHLDVGPVRRW